MDELNCEFGDEPLTAEAVDPHWSPDVLWLDIWQRDERAREERGHPHPR